MTNTNPLHTSTITNIYIYIYILSLTITNIPNHNDMIGLRRYE